MSHLLKEIEHYMVLDGLTAPEIGTSDQSNIVVEGMKEPDENVLSNKAEPVPSSSTSEVVNSNQIFKSFLFQSNHIINYFHKKCCHSKVSKKRTSMKDI